MNKAELIDAIAASAKISKADSKKALDGVDDGIFEIGLSDFNLLFSHLRLAK